MPHPTQPNKLINCIRGPKETLEEMQEEVARIYSGKVEFCELPYASLDTARGVLRDKIAMLHQDASRAMQRFRIDSIPGAERLRYESH